jgi:hypothetical protein
MDRTGTPRRLWSDRTIYLLLGLLVLVYLAFRAALVPWVHDECASLFWYVERGIHLPGQAHADANNHFLSTAIGVAAHKLRGLSLLVSRLGSLLAWPIYLWAVYRIGLGLKDRTVRWSAWVALLLCPFLLDFFSLFRGYALQVAFWAVAIDGGLRYAAAARTRHLVQLLMALVLANAAVLSLVPVWALIVAALAVPPALHWLRHDERPATAPVLAWALLGVLPLFIATLLSLELRRAGLLYHGSTEGFVAVTVRSIVRLLVGNGGMAAAWAVVALVAMALVQAVRRPVKPGPLVLLGALLAADVLVRIALAQVAGINYPADRAGLYLVPLAILVVAFAADAAAPRLAVRTIALLALWFLPLRTLYTANMDHTLLWPEQSVPVRFLQYIAAKQEGMGRPVVIGAYHQLGLALPYAARLHALPLDMPHTDGFPHGPHEVRIVDARFIDTALVGFHVVDHAPGPGLWLLEADRRLRTAIFSQRTFPATVTDDAFVWISRQDTVRLGEPVMLQLECRITASDVPADLRLVATVDSAGIEVHRMEKLLGAMRPGWHDDVLHTTLCMPARPHADHRDVYLWNPGGAQVDVRPVHVKRHRFPASVPH